MLEILFIWFLGKKIAAIATAKGRRPAGYVVLFVVMWFGGEISGAIASVATAGGGGPDMCEFYEFALLGAIVGGVITFIIVSCLPAIHDDLPLREHNSVDRDYGKHFGAVDAQRDDFTTDPSKPPNPEDHQYKTE
jgi:hypothetical protein